MGLSGQLFILSLILGVVGLVLGFMKNQTKARVGKSAICAAFLLFNGIFTYEPLSWQWRLSNVWKWYPAVIYVGIFAICLLIIWQPWNKKVLRNSALGLTGALVVLTIVTALVGTYQDSFLEELGRVTLWYLNLASIVGALVLFLCFRKNCVVSKIGISILCTLVWSLSWLIVYHAFDLRTTAWYWHTAIICIGVFICLLFIWKLFSVKARRVTAICLSACLAIMIGWSVGSAIYEKNILEIHEVGGWMEEVNLVSYEPFRANTLAKSLDEPSSLRLQGNLPRLDGATALYPLYAAFVRATYPEAEYKVYDKESGVTCSRTAGAFDNLIEGSADLVFLMGVSEEQHERARELGLELRLTPIGREAFVFFVNRWNRVSNLSVENIQDIYSGQITNWRDLGGGNIEILAYQRPDTSGSQVMLREIMGDVPLVYVPEANIFDEMKGMYMAVAYKNYRNSLGYSFLYYINDMIAENRIKFLSINGVAPTVDNIASGNYPYAHDFYAVSIIREPENEAEAERIINTEKLIEWILSPQGQSLVEKTGYVSLR